MSISRFLDLIHQPSMHRPSAEALQHWEEALLFTEDPCEKAPILEQMAQVLLILERSFDAIRTFDSLKN